MVEWGTLNSDWRARAMLRLISLTCLLFFSIGSSLAVSPLTSPNRPCTEIRGAIDIGSGTTKVKVAEVNKCAKSVGKLLYEKYVKVSYQSDLDNSKDKRFSSEIKKVGEAAIREVLLDVARKVTAQENIRWKSVAAAAFREAKNAPEFVKELNQKFPVNVRILNQVEEGILGYNSAFAYEPKPVNAVVWDIGGGSSQWVTEYKGEYLFHLFQIASENFKDRIIREIKKRPDLKTPNPISRSERAAAEKMLQAEAAQLNPKIKEILKENGKVIGIGSVHFYSVLGQIHGTKNKNKMAYTLDQVETAIQGRMGQADKQVGGDYAATDVTNLIYVATFMKSLGIKMIVVRKVNLIDGLLLD